MNDSVDEAVASLEDYLRRYPSGNFSELAQARLDRLLALQGERKIAPATSDQNPLSKGFAVARTDWRVGDRYEFRVVDLYSGNERRQVEVVTAVNEFEVVFNEGRSVKDLLGNTILRHDGVRFTNNQNYPAEFAVGRRWTSRYRFGRQPPLRGHAEIDWVVTAVRTSSSRRGDSAPFGSREPVGRMIGTNGTSSTGSHRTRSVSRW